MKLSKGIDMGLIKMHQSALWIVNEIFKQTAQPFDLDEIDTEGFTMNLRGNLQQVQFERLILKPLCECLEPLNEEREGYKIHPDYKSRKMRFVQHAGKGEAKKPARNKAQTSD